MDGEDQRKWLLEAADEAASLATERFVDVGVAQNVTLPDDELDLWHGDEDRDQLVEGGKAG